MTLVARGGELAVELDPTHWTLKFRRGGELLAVTPQAPRFQLAGQEATARQAVALPDGFEVRLQGQGVAGTWRVRGGGEAVTCVVEAMGAAADVAVGMELPLPLEAAIELPTGGNWGLRADRSAPIGRENGLPLSHCSSQLAAVALGDAALAIIGLSDYTRYLPGTYANVWREGAWRDDQAIWLALGCVGGVPFEISVQADLERVIDRYCHVLRQRLGIRTLAEDPSVAPWVHEIGLVLVLSMWRNTGEILNDFSDALRMAEDLKELGAHGRVLFRLVGWQGPFDSTYPFFAPAKGLGGPPGMRTLSDALHANGNRLAVHSNIWGMDPYHEGFEGIEHLAVPYDRVYERIPTGQIGPYDGWPGPYPAVPVGFDSGAVPLEFSRLDATGAEFQTVSIPEPMEAYLTVAGVNDFAAGRLRAVVGLRPVVNAAGSFARDDRCRFRFRFRLEPGVNTVRLEFQGGVPKWSKPTYRINGAVRGQRLWSWPIVRADIHHPQWTQVTRDNLGRTARQYDIDVVYLDATNIWRPSDRSVFDALKADLPDKVFGCEYAAELGYNMFRMTKVSVGGGKPAGAALAVSDFPRRIRQRFTRLHYLHHHFSEETGAPQPTLAFELFGDEVRAQAPWALAERPRQGIIPCAFVDYRKTGLDEPTRRLIRELGRD